MFTKTVHLSFSSEINVDVQALYEFHTDTRNLIKITPDWMKVSIFSLQLPMQKGSEVELDITRFGIKQRWKMKITEHKSGELICDKALKSPFASFIHHHKFESISHNTSKLTDELEFTLPLYPLSLLALSFVKRDIQNMFAYRHKQTKLLLEKNDV